MTGVPTPTVPLRDLRVIDEAGAHLIATGTSTPTDGARFNEGDPVILNWGRKRSVFSSVMYVHRVSDVGSVTASDPVYEFVLVGSSWPLKSSNQRALSNTNARRILGEIALSHNLSFDFSATNRNFDLFVSRESDWVGLRDLAHRVGGLLRVDGTTIRIIDMNAGLNDLVRAPVYRPRDLPAQNVTVTRRQQDKGRREVAVVNPVTLQVENINDSLRNESDVLLLKDSPSIALGSVSEAQQDLRSQRLSDRFREEATVTGMSSDPRLRPGTVVGMRGMTPVKNGYWTVTKADHRLTKDAIFSDLYLGRSSDHPRATLDRPPLFHGQMASSSSPVLRRDRWVAG